jgi:hypothetical protein
MTASKGSVICVWCGRAYSVHIDRRAPGAPVPRVPCLLLKSGFVERRDDVKTVPETSRASHYS